MYFTEKYNYLIEKSIATEDELELILRILGKITEETLDTILFIRTGYGSFESYDYYEHEIYENNDED